MLRLNPPPQREAAFRSGALGELAVGALLDKRAAKGPLIVLHDRRMPRGRGNIDHLAVAPAGVFVIDAKQYSREVRVVDLGFRGMRPMIAARDRTKLLEGLDRQLSVAREARWPRAATLTCLCAACVSRLGSARWCVGGVPGCRWRRATGAPWL